MIAAVHRCAIRKSQSARCQRAAAVQIQLLPAIRESVEKWLGAGFSPADTYRRADKPVGNTPSAPRAVLKPPEGRHRLIAARKAASRSTDQISRGNAHAFWCVQYTRVQNTAGERAPNLNAAHVRGLLP